MNLYDFLNGQWALKRDIQDKSLDREGSVHGHVHFQKAPEPSVLLYTETGEITYQDYSGPTQQSYRYKILDPHRANIFFSDQRYFHDLDLTTGMWSVSHTCGDDIYTGHYCIHRPDCLEIHWKVKGPRKDYRMTSRLEKF